MAGLVCTDVTTALLYHVFKLSGFPYVTVFDEQPRGTDVELLSRLCACETLISKTPVYPLIYGICSIIKHQCYVYTSYSVIIYPLINCLQDIIMRIKCEMRSPYARSMLMSYTKFRGRQRGRKRADESISLFASD